MACGNALSPNQLISGAGLLQNVGIGISPTFISNITEYASDILPMSNITSVLNDATSYLSGSTLENLYSLGDGVFPGLTNIVPADFQSVLGTGAFTTQLVAQANDILGSDLGVFSQHLSTAGAFATGSNEMITAALSGNNNLIASTDLNNLITGAISDTSLALPSFSTDLLNTGNSLNFGDLNNLGNPMSFVQNFQGQAGGLPIVGDALKSQGIDPGKVSAALSQQTSAASLLNRPANEFAISTSGGGMTSISPSLGGLSLSGGSVPAPTGSLGQATYSALGSIKGDNLASMQSILKSNISLTSAQDYLDPSILLPNVAPTLKGFDINGISTGIFKI